MAKFDSANAPSISLQSCPRRVSPRRSRCPPCPESRFRCIDVDQIIAATAIFELLGEAAGGHPRGVLREVSEEAQAILGELFREPN